MSQLILRELNENDELAFLKGMKDWENEKPHWHTFIWKPGMSHSEHLQKLKDNKDKNKVDEGKVPDSMLYAFVDGVIVGRISIRHELNDFLLARGGHVGYAVSPLYRKKGYATEIMAQGLDHCRELGMSKLLITCGDANEASWRIIEKFGGVLENKIKPEDEVVRRYWLKL